MREHQSIPERKHIVSTVDRRHRGHRLVEIAERIPGREPTDNPTPITDGPDYRSRYWRCRNCGAERNSRRDFASSCTASADARPDAGGYSIEEERTQEALADTLHVEHGDGTEAVVVDEANGESHRVDVDAETCTCSEAQEYCMHVRRVDIERRAGLGTKLAEAPWR